MAESIYDRLRKLRPRRYAADVIREYNERWKDDEKYPTVNPGEFSNSVSGVLTSPKANTVISRTLIILTEWEEQA